MGNVINVQMDEDFYNKVIANSGSSDSGESDFSTPIYYEAQIVDVDNTYLDLLVYPALIKTNIDGIIEFVTSLQMFSMVQTNIDIMKHIVAICFLPFRLGKNPTISLEDALGDYFSLFFKKRITKEEFYAE